jgi:hypothetical protein
MPDDPEDDLAERVDALEAAVRDLGDDRQRDSPPSRSPTDRDARRPPADHVLPATIAVLEANARALELLQAAIRASDDERAADRPPRAARDAVDRLDAALDALLAEFEEGAMPRDPDARAVVEDARDLRAEIDAHLADETRARPDADRSDDRPDPDEDEPTVEVDVEDELRSIKDDLDRDADRDDPDASDDADADDRNPADQPADDRDDTDPNG